jgi:hypothetical protein
MSNAGSPGNRVQAKWAGKRWARGDFNSVPGKGVRLTYGRGELAENVDSWRDDCMWA